MWSPSNSSHTAAPLCPTSLQKGSGTAPVPPQCIQHCDPTAPPATAAWGRASPWGHRRTSLGEDLSLGGGISYWGRGISHWVTPMLCTHNFILPRLVASGSALADAVGEIWKSGVRRHLSPPRPTPPPQGRRSPTPSVPRRLSLNFSKAALGLMMRCSTLVLVSSSCKQSAA